MRPFALVFAAVTLLASPALAMDRVSLAFQAEEAAIVAPDLQTERAAVPAIRQVISRQIEAVRQADAKTAFSAVSTRLRKQFSTDADYLRVVNAQFPAIAQARIVAFGDLRKTSFGLTQLVEISDSTGQPWLAFFLVDEEKGGQFGISNVVMVKMPAAEA